MALLDSLQDYGYWGILYFHTLCQDAEGVLVANIGSYMGGVDLWQNEDENYDNFDPQSMHDKILEVVSISGTWHLGKLQVCCIFQAPLSVGTW